MIKTFLLCCWAAVLTAQPVFQKKMDGLQAAEGLALMPDGGYTLAGLQGNCIQIIRFDPSGMPLWMRQVCPANPGADLTISSLNLVADKANPGAFMLLFRKGAFFSAPDNLLNLIKFDAAGNLLWESQLRPEKRYGAFSPGNQLALTPSGEAWAAHGMGYTNLLPDFNQVLIFKVSASGQVLLRRFFLTDIPTIVNGIRAKNNQEIFAYGGLGNAVSDGFLMKLDASGEVVWAKRYAGVQFLRDGGFFPNGDLLLMAKHENEYALTRIKPDGALVWASSMTDTLSLFHCSVGAGEEVFAAGRTPDTRSVFFKFSQALGPADWANAYEDCTYYNTTALHGTSDGGVIFTQSTITGFPRARFVKANAQGNLSPECPVWNLPLPVLQAVPVVVTAMQFTHSEGPALPLETFFTLKETALDIQDCCPTEYPEARFVLPDSVCINAPFSLVSSGNPCADEWHWQIPGAAPDAANTADFQNIVCATAGDFPVVLTESFGVCSSTFTDTLHAVLSVAHPIFAFSDTVLCPDAPFVVQPDLSDIDSWLWEDSSSTAIRILDPPVAGVYRLRAIRGFCAQSDSFRIQTGNCGPTRVFSPNVFSPNEDGQNDFWEVFLQPGVTMLHSAVYDRWGNLCYETRRGETPRWDGYFKARPAQSGVYIWQLRVLNAVGQEEELSGDLLLLR